MVLLQNCIDSLSIKICSHSAFCARSCQVGKEVIRVQVEGIAEMTEGEDGEPVASPFTERGVSFMSVDCSMLRRYPELPVCV